MLHTHPPLFSLVRFHNLLDELIESHRVGLQRTTELFEECRREGRSMLRTSQERRSPTASTLTGACGSMLVRRFSMIARVH